MVALRRKKRDMIYWCGGMWWKLGIGVGQTCFWKWWSADQLLEPFSSTWPLFPQSCGCPTFCSQCPDHHSCLKAGASQPASQPALLATLLLQRTKKLFCVGAGRGLSSLGMFSATPAAAILNFCLLCDVWWACVSSSGRMSFSSEQTLAAGLCVT